MLHFSSLPTVSTDSILENRHIQYSPLKQILIHNLTERADFYVHGTVHRNSVSISIQQDATIHILFHLQTFLHVSGGFPSIIRSTKTVVTYIPHINDK